MQIVTEDRSDAGRWLAGLRELRVLEAIPACSAAVHLLAHLQLGEEEAENLLVEILSHRGRLTHALNRDPGLRVALVDFLSNVDPRFTNPKIVEMAEFEQTERSAVTDALTGLYNRRLFVEALEREVRRSRRYHLPLSIVMLDLDGFKQVNDAYGHLFGDLVLERVARLLRRAVREADIACRYGGEEFAVILPETDRLGAHSVTERIRRRVQGAFAERGVGGRRLPLTISGGISSYPEDGSDPEALVGRADATLYQAKAAGKNRVMLYHAERRSSIRYPAKSTARVVVGPDSEPEGLPAVALNLSQSGVLLETRDRFRPAQPVRVILGREHRPGQDAAWIVHGKVVRVEPGRDKAHQFRVGVAFDAPVPEECLLAQLGGSRPSPRPILEGE